MGLDNENPTLFIKIKDREITETDYDDNDVEEIDSREIFDLIKGITDPEHPLSLEELRVVDQSLIEVDDLNNIVKVLFTPTIPHCSMATLIGLSIKVRLLWCLPSRFKISVSITPGTHASEHAINKQLDDKERVAAALENTHLSTVLHNCIATA
ncbi:MIP18 family protein galla-2 [Daktulosphaira vitifoliae]|uniref:MIP18 family protein galla-2 n=1 Tax=Daktulosphaira vitifoliae TaxID=58002 RepID=UPI0021AAB412|nr:MIP18 family protein galla-2 [Daktulosphaira vitifoliae]